MKRQSLARWHGPLLFSALLLLTVEALLRVGGFEYAHTPIGLRYAKSIAKIGHGDIRYGLDPVLLWKPLPTRGVTNSQGFLGPEWPAEKPKGATRVIALGDSCTVAGAPPYPALLSRFGREVLNAGVGSWSSYQGLRLLPRLLELRPDAVTIYFGWNDHWLAWAAPDKELAALLDRQWRVLELVRLSRLLQALLKLADRARGGRAGPAPDAPPRVSPEDYAANLRAIVRLVRAAGAKPVLVTAPTSLTPKHPMTRRLVLETRNFHDPARIAAVHSEYNAVVRAVAKETGAALADLDAALSGQDAFFTDGIHLSAAGHRRAAWLLDRKLRTLGL